MTRSREFCRCALLAAAGLTLAVVTLPGTASAQFAGLPQVVLASPEDDQVRASPRWRERLVAIFLEGITRDEAKRERGVAKWTGPVDISLRGAGALSHIAFVQDLAAELAALTGLPVSVSTDQRRVGALDVFVSSVASYWPPFLRAANPAERVFTCAAAPSVANGVIRRSTVRINAGALPPATVRACLVEEIVQSMGLLGEVTEPRGTILNDAVGYQGLGIVDRLLLKTLYDPRLVPGMSGAAAEPVAGAVLQEQLGHLVCRDAVQGAARRCRLL
jgi:hypothetical protein